MSEDPDHVEQKARERERLRALIERLGDEELRSPVNEYWTVAGVLGHIAFWDARVLALAAKLERGEPFSPDDNEPEDVDWINDASRPLIHAIPPREAARLALELAEQTDVKVAGLLPGRLWPQDPDSPIDGLRARTAGSTSTTSRRRSEISWGIDPAVEVPSGAEDRRTGARAGRDGRACPSPPHPRRPRSMSSSTGRDGGPRLPC